MSGIDLPLIARMLLQPEVLVGRAHEKFDADGHLVARGDT